MPFLGIAKRRRPSRVFASAAELAGIHVMPVDSLPDRVQTSFQPREILIIHFNINSIPQFIFVY